MIFRDEAFEVLKKYNKEPFHIQHALTVEPVHEMEKVLFAADELSGLIWSASLMRPSKSVQDMEVKSVRKKYKDLKFAAGCSREVINTGAERLGWELDKLIQMTLDAMRSCESSVEDYMAANY